MKSGMCSLAGLQEPTNKPGPERIVRSYFNSQAPLRFLVFTTPDGAQGLLLALCSGITPIGA